MRRTSSKRGQEIPRKCRLRCAESRIQLWLVRYVALKRRIVCHHAVFPFIGNKTISATKRQQHSRACRVAAITGTASRETPLQDSLRTAAISWRSEGRERGRAGVHPRDDRWAGVGGPARRIICSGQEISFCNCWSARPQSTGGATCPTTAAEIARRVKECIGLPVKLVVLSRR